jgi:hypothetical protein
MVDESVEEPPEDASKGSGIELDVAYEVAAHGDHAIPGGSLERGALAAGAE